jgi:hypothetical protein
MNTLVQVPLGSLFVTLFGLLLVFILIISLIRLLFKQIDKSHEILSKELKYMRDKLDRDDLDSK